MTQSTQPCPELPEQLLCCASVRKTFPSQRCNVFPTSPKEPEPSSLSPPSPDRHRALLCRKEQSKGEKSRNSEQRQPSTSSTPRTLPLAGKQPVPRKSRGCVTRASPAVSLEPSCVLLLRGQSCELHMEHLVCTARPPRESRRAEPTKHNLGNIKAQRRIPLVQKRFPGQLNANHLTASQEIDV